MEPEHQDPAGEENRKSRNCKAFLVVNLQKPCNITIWNVSLTQVKKVYNAVREIELLDVDVPGLSDVQWRDAEKKAVYNK